MLCALPAYSVPSQFVYLAMAEMENFTIVEHTIASAYIREYAYATVRDQEGTLQLHVKQYIPRATKEHAVNAITIIAFGALGMPKELYEPLWDELYRQSTSSGKFSIVSIWIADPANTGISSILNEGKLGDDPSWIDHCRDIFLMINQFQAKMHRPLIGLAHSAGGVILSHLALFHPRLFTSVILMDPYLTPIPPPNLRINPIFRRYTVNRPNSWSSREVAEAELQEWPIYHGWDPRCLNVSFYTGCAESEKIRMTCLSGLLQAVRRKSTLWRALHMQRNNRTAFRLSIQPRVQT